MILIAKLSTDELQKVIPLIKQTQLGYELEGYSDDALKVIMKSINKAKNEMSNYLLRYKDTITDWRKDRYKKLEEELNNLTLSVQQTILSDITKSTIESGVKSYSAQNEILSWGGRVSNFNNVSLSSAQLRSMVINTPIGGNLLNKWITKSFDTNIQEKIKTELLTGMLKGESYRNMIKRFNQKVFSGIKNDMEAITRTYVQSVNVNAMDDVMRKNDDIVKGWKWNSVLENRTCLRCMSLDARGEVYKIGEGPEMPAHMRCRCFKEIVTKSFKELGVNTNEIEESYRAYSIRGKIDPLTGKLNPGKIGVGGGKIIELGRFLGDYDSFFKAQAKIVQVQMLGPGRYDLWKSGKVKLKDFADKNGKIYLLTELNQK